MTRVSKIGPPKPPAKPFVIPHIPGPPKPGAAHAGSAAAPHAGAHSGKWDEAKHPRDHGKFSHTPGAQGEQAKPAEPTPAERVDASMKDPAFLAEHGDRLQSAAITARSAFGRELSGSDHATPAAQEAMRAEVERIHREQAGEAHDPEAASAEHRAIGERHHGEHQVRLAAAEEQRVREARAADDRDLEAAGELEKAKQLTPLPKEVAAAEKSLEAVRSARSEAVASLDETANHAAAALREVGDLRDDTWGVGSDELLDADDFASSHESITGHRPEVPSNQAADFDPFEGAPGDPDDDDQISEELAGNTKPGLPKPKRDEYDSDEDFSAALAEYPEASKTYDERRNAAQAAVEERKAKYAAAAERARTALQAHLERQEAALEKLTEVGAKHDEKMAAAREILDGLEEGSGINEKHFKGLERDEDGEFVNEQDQAKYDEAVRLDERRLEIWDQRLDEGGEGDSVEDFLGGLKDSVKETKATLKALDKILKPKKTRAKKSNRPGHAGAANVVGMARYKLKLSKLDFISLVDKPAQETASIRLIKRAGAAGGDQVKARAVARVVKIGDGKNPLVYCWALTCTGEDGQPYHDLQGDAIQPDAFIKAAEEFMAAGAAVDEMHDGKQTSKVAFAFPMDADIARGMFGEAIGKQVKTSGLMVAIRPAPEALAKLRSGAYTGVSIAGLGTREVAKRAPATGKVAKGGVVMTTVEAGHQHTVDMTGYDDSVRNSGQTSSQTSEGAEEAHSHAWIRDPMTGAIHIAMDSGHTHEVEMPGEAALDEEEAGEGEEGDGEEGYSPPDDEAPSVKSMSNLTLFKRALELPEEHRAYLAQLETEEAAELLNSGKLAEEFAKADAEDPVVFTAASGETFRKSDDGRLVALAKRNDELAKDAEIQKAAREKVELEKRAGVELVGFAKSVDVKVAVVKAIESIPDEAVRKEAWEMLRGARAAFAMLGKAHGVNPGDATEAETPIAKFHAARVEFAKTVTKTDKPTDAQIRAVTGQFIRTEEGAALYAEAHPSTQSA